MANSAERFNGSEQNSIADDYGEQESVWFPFIETGLNTAIRHGARASANDSADSLKLAPLTIDEGGGERTYQVSAASPADWHEALLRIRAESKKLTDPTGPRAGDVFQQGVAQMLETVTKYGADANGRDNIKVELDPAKGTSEAQKELIAKRRETMERLKREGWQVVQSQPGSVADMAGYDIIMINKEGQWFPIDTTLDRAGKGRNSNLLIETNVRPFFHHPTRGDEGAVRLKPEQQIFCNKAIDDLGKIMDRMGGPDGRGFPALGDLRPPSLDASGRRTHADILQELQNYREKVREFADAGAAHQELLDRLDASIRHRQRIVGAEANARANVERDLGEVLKDLAERIQRGEIPRAKDALAFNVAGGMQTVSLDRKGHVVVTDTGKGTESHWSAEKRTQLELGDFRSMVDAQLEKVVPDMATREKIRQMLDKHPEALNSIWGDLSKRMADVVDVGRTVEQSRRRPLNTKEAAQVEMSDRQARDFFKELTKSGEGEHTDARNRPTNELLEELKNNSERLAERQKEYDKVKEAYDKAVERKAQAEARKQTASRGVIEAIQQNKTKLENGFPDLGTPDKPGRLRQQQTELQNELSKRARSAFDRAFDMHAPAYNQSTVEMMDAIKERATIVPSEKTGVVFRDRKTGREYFLSDLAAAGKITTTSDGKPALKMEGAKDPIALDKLEIEIRVGKESNPQQAQRQILQGLTEIHQALTFDERRFGGNLNTTKAADQLKADREHLEGDFARKAEQAQKQAEREIVIEHARKTLEGTELNNENKEFVEEALKEALEKSRAHVSEETRRELAKEVDAYKRGDNAAVERMHKELAPPERNAGKPAEPTAPTPMVQPKPGAYVPAALDKKSAQVMEIEFELNAGAAKPDSLAGKQMHHLYDAIVSRRLYGGLSDDPRDFRDAVKELVSSSPLLKDDPLAGRAEIVLDKSIAAGGQLVFEHNGKTIRPCCRDGQTVYYEENGALRAIPANELKVKIMLSASAFEAATGSSKNHFRAVELFASVYHQLIQLEQLSTRLQRGKLTLAEGVKPTQLQVGAMKELVEADRAVADLAAHCMQFRSGGRRLSAQGAEVPRAEKGVLERPLADLTGERFICRTDNGRLRIIVIDNSSRYCELNEAQTEEMIKRIYEDKLQQLSKEMSELEKSGEKEKLEKVRKEHKRVSEDLEKYNKNAEFKQSTHARVVKACRRARAGVGVVVTTMFLADWALSLDSSSGY